MLQNQKIENLDVLVSRLKPFLRRYLEERNVTIDDKGWFRCINPSHEDKNPSCGFVKGTDEQVFFCFSCGAKGSITHAAHLLEDKPLRGEEFVSENVLYLADKYGIEYDKIELSEEELYIRRIYKAYEEAADIISEYQPIEYIKERNWPVTLCRELQIGSPRSYEDFTRKMSNRGYEKHFLEEIDLNSYIFNEGMLIFTVKNEKGKVVGFSARNMSHSKDSKKSKFINTSAKCPIYNKGITLYGLDVGLKHGQPLYIYEGYPDFVTSYKHGIKNVCAIGGTALTKDHIALLRSCGISDIVLALDGDAAGQLRIEGILDQYFSGDETIKIRILKFPDKDDECDPDEFLEKYGAEEFNKLSLMTPFQWQLDRFSYDSKPEEICDTMIPLIVNDPNEIHRELMCKQLAEKTGVRLKSIYRQLEKIIDVEEARKDGTINKKIQQMISELRYPSDDPLAIIEETADELRQMTYDNREDLHSQVEVVSFVDQIKSVFETRKPGLQGWTTGYELFDSSMSGIPKEDTMITFAGDANVGKTGFMFELALRLAKLNDNIMVLFMSIDDSRQQAIARLVALESGLRINQVSHPTENIKTDQDNIKLENGWRAMRKLIEDGRFSIKDNSHGNTLDFAESWIRWVKENNPDKEIAFFLDNFHKLGDEKSKDERVRFKHASGRIHALKNKLHFTAICTMEIRKLLGGQKNQRPILQDISESKQMEYDNNLIGMVYSDLHAKRQDSKVFWTDMVNEEMIRKPVIEIDVQKNKITEFKGVLYYKFNPEYSKFCECDNIEMQTWRREYDEALKKVMDKVSPEAGDNPFISSKIIDTF